MAWYHVDWASQAAGISGCSGMVQTETPVIVVILLSCCAALLLVVLMSIFQIFKKLGRIENQLSRSGGFPDLLEQAPAVVETSNGGLFEAFLSEDPSRRGLTKGEQSAAYRKWRQQKGMNWSNS